MTGTPAGRVLVIVASLAVLTATTADISLAQAVVQPPAPAAPAPQTSTSQGSGGLTVNVTPPPPDPTLLAQTEQQGAPYAGSGFFSSFDRSVGQADSTFLNFGQSFANFQTSFVTQPRVQQMNHTLSQVVLGALGLVIAVLACWGLFGPLLGSDFREAMEMIGRVPLYALVAVTSLTWGVLMMQLFGAIGAAMSGTLQSVFGPTLAPALYSLPDNPPVGPFGDFNLFAQILCGALYVVLLLIMIVELVVASVMLGLLFAIAPPCIFAGALPWTRRFSARWWHATTSQAADLCVMGAVIGLGGPIIAQFTQTEPIMQILFRIILVFVFFRARALFGTQLMGGSSMLSSLFAARMLLRSLGPAGAAASVATSAASGAGAAAAVAPRPPVGPTQPPASSASAWGQYGTAASAKPRAAAGAAAATSKPRGVSGMSGRGRNA